MMAPFNGCPSSKVRGPWSVVRLLSPVFGLQSFIVRRPPSICREVAHRGRDLLRIWHEPALQRMTVRDGRDIRSG